MRSLLLVAALLIPGLAQADTGVYLADGIGGAGFLGQLSRYGDGDIRMLIGLGIRSDDDLLLIYGTMTGGLFEECDVSECADEPIAQFGTFGIDFRKRIPLLYMRRLFSGNGTYEHPVLSLELGGGPRWNWGDFGASHVISGDGPGLGANVTLSADFWIIGYYLQAGLDVQHFNLDDGTTVRGSTPYLLFGGKVGWL